MFKTKKTTLMPPTVKTTPAGKKPINAFVNASLQRAAVTSSGNGALKYLID